ncbi:MAG TPA: hypothetical protein VM597_34355 [Gemmataceae bacterium]|jgi:hypothetical protein|nr:hypothetical protein [Gemmataceae bacterium]
MTPAEEAAERYAEYEHAAKADRRASRAWCALFGETGDWEDAEDGPAREARYALARAKAAARSAYQRARLEFFPSPHEDPLLFDGTPTGPPAPQSGRQRSKSPFEPKLTSNRRQRA